MKTDTGELLAYPESELGARLAQLRIRISGRLRLGLYASSLRYGLRRDLTQPLVRPSAKIPLAVRPLIKADLESLLFIDEGDTREEKLEVARRRAFAAKRAQGCFVAVDQRTDTPCYMQWLFSPADNSFVRRMGGFPELQQDEALLENAYTPAKFRGLGIMSAAMALIAERGADVGARYVLTFVGLDNVASLKGCQRAGFFPDLLHHKTQMGFGLFARDAFNKLPENDARRKLSF